MKSLFISVLTFLVVIHCYPQNAISSFDDYRIHFYCFNLEVTNMTPDLEGNVELGIEINNEGTDTIILELVNEASIDSIFQNSDKSEFNHSNDLIYIPLTKQYSVGENLNLTIYYQIIDGDFKPNRGIINKTERSGNTISFTLSEPFYSKNWFPCKQDLKEKIDSAYLNFTCPDSCMVGSNGILTNVIDLDNGKTRFEWKTYHPMAYYLISYSVADYLDYSFYADLGNNDSTLVQNFIYNDSSYLLKYKKDIDATADMLKLFSELFGSYPFKNEKYGHCLAPISGGMEHQTMTTLSDFRFSLVAHELGHQWFGDYITCSNWQDIWINEGFASYTELLAYEFLGTEEEYLTWILDAFILITSEPDGSIYVPEAELENDRRIFNHRLSYEKGAYIIHMIRHEIGNDSIFFQVLQEFLKEYGNSYASAENFKTTLYEFSHIDFTTFFDQWYYGEGYPILDFHWIQKNDSLILEIDQETTASGESPFFDLLIDIKISFLGGDTLVQIRPVSNNDKIIISLNEKVYKINPNPDKWLLAEIRSVTRRFEDDSSTLFGVFPNPARNEIFIENYQIGLPFNAKLYSAKGIFIDEVSSTEAFASFPLDSLAAGFYQVVVTRDSLKEVFKVAKF